MSVKMANVSTTLHFHESHSSLFSSSSLCLFFLLFLAFSFQTYYTADRIDILKIDSGSIFCLFVVVRRSSYCLCISNNRKKHQRKRKKNCFTSETTESLLLLLFFAVLTTTSTEPSQSKRIRNRARIFRSCLKVSIFGVLARGAASSFAGLRRNIAKKRRRKKKI